MRRAGRWIMAGVALWVGVAVAAPAGAFEFFDGRLQVHGAMSQEFRTLADGYRVRPHIWFMSAMKTKLSVEIEAEIFPDGIGPFDIVEGFARLDVSYDCLWEKACHMADQWNYFGDDAGEAPENWANGRTRGVTGVLPDPLDPIVLEQPDRELVTIADIDPFDTLLSLGSEEDIQITFASILPAKITSKFASGSLSPITLGLGPINPEFEIDSTGSLIGVPPAVQADLPLRPLNETLFNPSAGLRRRIGRYDNPDVNFTENELAWNLGASQQQTKFLREAYLDVTMLDGRLVLRLSKQITRWGKTELFRSGTPDQLNPQDLAISNLPSFEDSLIALWQARAVASFYNVGPFEDFRVEAVLNLDHFEPADLGDCGEPYTVFLVCQKQFGLLAHGFSGLGIAGERRPPNWWEDASGLEFGLRVEFRLGRFSVSITDFYGYDDFPTSDWFQPFERNVDPRTGRPRIVGATGPCEDLGGDTFGDSPDCLRPENAALFHSGNRQVFDTFCKATQSFDLSSLPIPLPLSNCVISIFNNPDPVPGLGTVPELLALFLAGGDFCNSGSIGVCLVANGVFGRTPITPLNGAIPLHPGLDDGVAGGVGALTGFLSDEQEALLGCGPFYGTDCNTEGIDLFQLEASVLFQAFPQVEHRERPLQGAVGTRFLPGVGLVQLPGARSVFTYFDDPVGFRWNPSVDGCAVGLTNLDAWSPGFGTAVYNDLIARGVSPGDALQCDADPNDHAGNGAPAIPAGTVASLASIAGLDGYQTPIPDAMIPGGLPINFTRFDQTGGNVLTVDEIRDFYPSEMASVSENLQRLLVLISQISDPASACDFDQPLQCEFLTAFFEISAVQRPELRAGGNGVYGRRDASWMSGAELDLFYERRNVLGVSLDFAEDWSKTTWGVDFTWIEDAPYLNQRADNGYSKEDTLNLVMSIDRPTFVNFLSANRTIFFNAQFFLRYIPGYKRRDTFNVDGPFSLLATLTAFTGFWQDRLLAFVTLIHEVESNSGGQIFTMTYRFSEAFSATVGLSTFYGAPSRERVLDISPQTRFHTADFTQRTNFRGVSPIAERDELFFSIRKTF